MTDEIKMHPIQTVDGLKRLWKIGVETGRILQGAETGAATPKPPAGGDAIPAGWRIEDGKPISEAPCACHVLAGWLERDAGEWIMAVVSSPPIYPFTHWWPLPGMIDTPKPPAGGAAGAIRKALLQAVGALQPFADADEGDAEDADHMAVWPTFTVGDLRRAVDAVKEGTAALALPAPVVEGERWRHVKRGTVYEVIGYAELQNGNVKGLREGAELVVYRGEDGKLWARERGEFHDGRFAALSEGRNHG